MYLHSSVMAYRHAVLIGSLIESLMAEMDWRLSCGNRVGLFYGAYVFMLQGAYYE